MTRYSQTPISDPFDGQLYDPEIDHAVVGANYYHGTLGETITAMMTVYLKSDGKFWKTDADTLATIDALIGVALYGGNADDTVNIALPAGTFIVRDDTWAWATIGAPVYFDGTTAGGLTDVKPSSGQLQRKAGYVLDADAVFMQLGNNTVFEVP